MRMLSRRHFVAGGAALGVVQFSLKARAQAGILTRYEATSSQGQAMLEKYARAVAKMMDKTQTPEADPLSWLFQWYTHSVDPSKGMTAEIARVYAGAGTNDPRRLLALTTWNTCQPHRQNGLPQQQRMFLPWHRMYVYLFERIIRKVINDDTFTLPYWDYTTPGKNMIPEQFRMPNDPLYKVLYRANRNDGSIPGTADVNAGQPIDQNDAPLNLDALAQRDYDMTGVAPGFNAALDAGLHGDVHVLVGDPSNMGSVPWAARDPIFWMHHCNIDRLWASWNKAGRRNPVSTSWLNQSFSFSNESGNRADPVVRDFVDTESLADGPYKYDQPAPVPALPPTPAAATVAAFAPSIIANQAQPGPVNLSTSRPVPVPLTTVAAVPMSAHVAAGRQNQRVYLVLQDLQAQAQPGIRYNVYLDPPLIAPTGPEGPVGAINFFDAVGHGDHGGTSQKFYSFDVTDRFTGAAASSGPPTVRIAPAGTAAANARAVVGSVSLVRQ